MVLQQLHFELLVKKITKTLKPIVVYTAYIDFSFNVSGSYLKLHEETAYPSLHI